MELPSASALQSIIEDLNRSLDGAEQTQRRIMRVTASATSPDRLVTAQVGPRGQLIRLDIDPRIYRTPNAGALAATIVATVREAAERATAEVQAIVAEALPKDMGLRRVGSLDVQRMIRSNDADLLDEEDSDGLDLR